MRVTVGALLLVLCLIAGTTANAGNPFERAERETGIPAEVLIAVAKTESDLSPYAFAVWSRVPLAKLQKNCSLERKFKRGYLYNGCFFSSYTKALSFLNYLERMRKRGTVLNYSTGLMQVNSAWIDSLDIDPKLLLDPSYNVLLGALILKFYLDLENGDYTKALSRYYGSTSVSPKYLRRVYKNLKLVLSLLDN